MVSKRNEDMSKLQNKQPPISRIVLPWKKQCQTPRVQSVSRGRKFTTK